MIPVELKNAFLPNLVKEIGPWLLLMSRLTINISGLSKRVFSLLSKDYDYAFGYPDDGVADGVAIYTESSGSKGTGYLYAGTWSLGDGMALKSNVDVADMQVAE